MGLLGLSVFSVPGRRAFWAIVVTALVTLALLSGWRLAVFSDVLPNTFWAKRWPPYAAFGLGGRLAGALELPSFFVVPVVALVLAGGSGFSLAAPRADRRRPLAILAAPIVGCRRDGAPDRQALGLLRADAVLRVCAGVAAGVLLFSDWVDAGRSGASAARSPPVQWGPPSPFRWRAFPSALGRLRGGAFGVTPHTYAESGQIFRRFAAAAD